MAFSVSRMESSKILTLRVQEFLALLASWNSSSACGFTGPRASILRRTSAYLLSISVRASSSAIVSIPSTNCARLVSSSFRQVSSRCRKSDSPCASATCNSERRSWPACASARSRFSSSSAAASRVRSSASCSASPPTAVSVSTIAALSSRLLVSSPSLLSRN